MFRTNSLKPLIYSVPGAPQQERVAQIIQTIEQTGTIVSDRVALHPEFVNCNVKCPVKFSLPPGVIWVRCPGKGPGDMVIDYNPGIWRNPSPAKLLRLSESADVSIAVVLKIFKRTFYCDLSARNRVCEFTIELTGITGVEVAERKQLVQKLAERLQLPLDFSPESASPIAHGNSKVSVNYREPTASSTDLRLELPEKLYGDILRQLLIVSKGKIDCWRIEEVGLAPYPKLVSELNRVDFPSRKTEMTYTWRLQSYHDFPALTEMAARNDYGEVMHPMFEFEFNNRKRGQFDIAAGKKGGFKLWFSFDAKEDQAEFSRLTGIKLKEEH